MMNIIFQLMKTIGKSTRVPELTENPGSSPSEPFWAPCPSTSTFRVELRKLSKSMMIGKALLSGLWARPVGCWCPFIISHISSCFTVRFTFLFTTLVATRLCRCLLRSDYMWAVMPWRLAPCDLGDPGWGDPWFPHDAFVASLTFWYGLVILMFFPLFLLPYHVEMILFFPSKRLHGFRQVVQHVQLHVANRGKLAN